MREAANAGSPFWIGEAEGYTPQIGRLTQMLGYARRTTLDAVRGLTTEQLDHLHDEKSNSIGMLLAHIAAVDYAYQIATFELRGLSDEERAEWLPALGLGKGARDKIRGQPLEHYLDRLAAVREETLRRMATVSDEWLESSTPFWNGFQANNYFKWFHVMEDEVSHRGQIRWLRQRLP